VRRRSDDRDLLLRERAVELLRHLDELRVGGVRGDGRLVNRGGIVSGRQGGGGLRVAHGFAAQPRYKAFRQVFGAFLD